MTERRKKVLVWTGIVVGYAAVIALMYWRAWRGKMANFDCTAEYWPDIEFQLGALRNGELPLWNPYSLGGYSFAGDVQAGTFSPLNWVCWLIGGITGPTPWLIQIKIWLGLWVALIGVHLLVYRRTKLHAPAAIAALIYVFGAPLLIHKNGAYLWPFLFLPWAVLALERFTDAPSMVRAAGLAIAVWLVGTAGHPHSFFIALVTLAGLWVARLAAKPGLVAALRAQAPWLALAVVLAAMLLAATLVPAIDAVAYSPRAHRTLGWITAGGMSNAQYGALFVPDVTGNWSYDVYMGPLAVLAPIVLVAITRSRAERVDRSYWIAIALLGFGLAAGAGLLRFFALHVPGFGLFRVANRWKAMAALPIAILVGEAVAAAIRGSAWRWWRHVWIGAGAAFLVVAAIIKFRGADFLLAAGVIGAALAVVLDRRRARYHALALVAIVLIDLFHAGQNKLSILGLAPDVDGFAPTVAQMQGGARDWRYIDPRGGVPRWVAIVDERRELSGHENPIVLERRDEVERAASKNAPLLLAHFNVRWYRGLAPPGATHLGRTYFLDYPAAAPVVRWYGGGVVTGAHQALEQLAATPPDALRVALVDPFPDPGAVPAGDAAFVDGRVTSYARNALTVEVDAPAAGVLVVNELWFPGWEAELDGAATRLYRANYMLRAVTVPAGHHVVAMRFVPRGYPYVLIVFFIGLLAAGAIVVAPWLNRRLRA